MLAFKDVLIFPIACKSLDYKPDIGLIRKCTDLSSTFSPSNSISSSFTFASLGSNQRRLKRAISNIVLLPRHFWPNLHFGLLCNLAGGVIMQFSYLKHLFMRHFASLPRVNQLFFHSPQLSTVSVNRSAQQVNQLAL